MKESPLIFDDITIEFKLNNNILCLKFIRDVKRNINFIKLSEIISYLMENLPEFKYCYFEDSEVYNFIKHLIKVHGYFFHIMFEYNDKNNSIENILFKSNIATL